MDEILKTLLDSSNPFPTRAFYFRRAVSSLPLDTFTELMNHLPIVIIYGLIGCIESEFLGERRDKEDNEVNIGALLGLRCYEHSPEVSPTLVQYFATNGKVSVSEVAKLVVEHGVHIYPDDLMLMMNRDTEGKACALLGAISILNPELLKLVKGEITLKL